MAELRQEARARAHGQAPKILLADIDAGAIEKARVNARKARVRVGFRCSDIADLAWPGAPALVVSNPPYGERLASGPEFLRRVRAAGQEDEPLRVGATARQFPVVAGVEHDIRLRNRFFRQANPGSRSAIRSEGRLLPVPLPFSVTKRRLRRQ